MANPGADPTAVRGTGGSSGDKLGGAVTLLSGEPEAAREPSAGAGFLLLHGAPNDTPPTDDDDDEGVAPVAPFSVSPFGMTASQLSETMSDISVAAQTLGGVTRGGGGREPAEGGRGSSPPPPGPPPSDATASGIGGEASGSPGTGGTPGTSAGDSSTSGGQARGGLVTGSEAEHPITAQRGEFIMRETAVRKYGVAFMRAVNAGKVRVAPHDRYLEDHAMKGYSAQQIRETPKPRRNHTMLRGA